MSEEFIPDRCVILPTFGATVTDNNTATVDWNDRQWRRRLCTALIEIINEHRPEGDSIVALAESTPSLTAEEVEAVRAYFGARTAVGRL